MHCNSLHFLSQVAISTISVSKSESISSISVESVCGPLALGGKVVGGGCHLSGGVRGGHCAVGVGHEGGNTIGPTSVESTISQPWLGVSISGPLSISVESTIAIPSIAKAKTVAVKATVSVPGVSLWLGLSISGPLAISVESTIAITSIAKAIKASVTVVGISISGPLSIAIAKAKAVSTIAKAKTVAVKTTVSIPRISLWLGLSISGPLAIAVESTIAIASISKAIKASIAIVGIGVSITLAQTVSNGSNSVDAGRDSGISETVSSVETAIAVPGVGLRLSLSVALPQVSGQGKAVASVGSVGSIVEGLGGQVVGGSSLDRECGVWHLGIANGHQLAGGGVGVNGDNSGAVSQPWLGLGSSRGGGDQSSSSKSLHG